MDEPKTDLSDVIEKGEVRSLAMTLTPIAIGYVGEDVVVVL